MFSQKSTSKSFQLHVKCTISYPSTLQNPLTASWATLHSRHLSQRLKVGGPDMGLLGLHSDSNSRPWQCQYAESCQSYLKLRTHGKMDWNESP